MVIKNEIVKRENYLAKIRGFYHTKDIIKVITGIRHSGKSSLMQMIAEELIASGVRTENILYLNLDKKEYRKIRSSNELEDLIDSISKVDGDKYLFIDEIQNVTNLNQD